MKKIMAMILCFILIVSISGCSKNEGPSLRDSDSKEADSSVFSRTDNQNADTPSRYIVDTSSLTFESSMENVHGEIIDIYSDNIHRYYIFRATNELNVLSLPDERKELLVQKYSDNPDALIFADAAEERLREAILQYFPEYDDSKLKLESNDESGSPLEYYSYIVYEYDGMNRVNTASISIAFDGTVTLVTGSHNSPEVFKGSDVYTDSQIESIVFDYVLNEKDRLAQEIHPEGEYRDVNGNIMPQYKFLVSSHEDMKDFSLEKIVYNGKACWQAEFTLVSSWSEIDDIYDITNIVFHVYVDAISGEVVHYLHT